MSADAMVKLRRTQRFLKIYKRRIVMAIEKIILDVDTGSDDAVAIICADWLLIWCFAWMP